MFTGLVEQMATITSIERSEKGTHLVLACQGWKNPVIDGESICTSGCCLTVVESSVTQGETRLSFIVVPESLRCTTIGKLTVGDNVNIERSLCADALLGGHFVQGHIDGVESLLDVSNVNDDERRLRITMKVIDQDTVVHKGSITVDGVSLTIARVGEGWFEVVLVPTTLQETTLGRVSTGDNVNIETDILARTVVQVVRRMHSAEENATVAQTMRRTKNNS